MGDMAGKAVVGDVTAGFSQGWDLEGPPCWGQGEQLGESCDGGLLGLLGQL